MNESIVHLTALDTLPVRTAIVDAGGIIVSVNEAWKSFGSASGLQTPNFGIGSYYLQHSDWSDDRAIRLREELHDLLSGNIDLLTHAYPCHANGKRQWFVMFGVPLSKRERAGAALMHIDLNPFLPNEMLENDALVTSDVALTRHLLLRAIADRSLAPQISAPIHRDGAAKPAPTKPASPLPDLGLSPRQAQVFALVGTGKTNQEIAAALGISLNTVKLHVSAILRRLDLASRTQIVLLASRAQE